MPGTHYVYIYPRFFLLLISGALGFVMTGLEDERGTYE